MFLLLTVTFVEKGKVVGQVCEWYLKVLNRIFHKACSAVANKNFQRKYINSVITLTLFQKEMNLIVQSMYELCGEWGFVFAQGKLMAYNKTTQYEENIS